MAAQHYPRHTDASGVAPSPDLPATELDVLAYWDADGTFTASIENREAGENGENEYVFYDGPPFANGLPHYGHLLTGYAKDVVPRYQTMRGKRVERRFGWDTHGLPAELEAMDQLGIKTKDEIVAMGIEKFNAASRSSVLKYTDEWREYVTRQARWVDFDNDYKTLNADYMESVLWAFKELWDKGLVYEGFKVLPYCWNDQTPLSNHELRMDDDVYQMRQDPSVTVGYRLETGELALIWTTTPWTMPSNLLVVVGEDIDYVVVESEFTGSIERYILAEERLEAYARELADGDVDALRERIVGRLKGSDLVGRAYTPPFNYFLGQANAHRIVADDYVTTTDGTGLVHNAGAFGEEDKRTTDRVGIEAVRPVGPDGAFIAPVNEYAGMLVFDANAPILDHLKARTRGEGDAGSTTEGTVLLRRETYDHSYPHCWRCSQPLIYMGVSSWFVEVTKFKDRMVELNEAINWVPGHIKDGQFGKWLSNARDWSISRNRFWGSPIPVWRSDDPAYPRIDVYGSLEEIEADFGLLPRNSDGEVDLHRPYVDALTRPNPDDPTGKSTMRRVEDVLDVWFDSGSMSFAQVHHPFENAEWFEHHFPADFIVEYINQTRGWFYTLHVLSTALFDRPAFSTCMCHGIILGNDGFKASKSRRNYPDVNDSFAQHGSDAVRWFLMASPILRGGNLVVTEEGIRDAVRQILLPLWNTWYFFGLYANTTHDGEGYQAKRVTSERVAELPEMDRYLLARTHDLAVATTQAMDAYDIAGACALVRDHLDVLTNWYVRTQRDRFWAEDTDAYDTLWTALETLTRLMAPLAPMVTEEIWRGLTGGRSVHLTDWPVTVSGESVEISRGESADGAFSSVSEYRAYDLEDGLVPDAELVAAMDRAREVVSAAHALRKANQLRVRQPLRTVHVVDEAPQALAPFTALIADELNVKNVELVSLDERAKEQFGISMKLTVNARAAGPRLGRDVQAVIKAARAGDWSENEGVVVAGGIELHDGEYELVTEVADGGTGESAASVLPGGGFVVLDLALDDELRAEGYARDVVRQVQDARKAAGLHVADRITLTLSVPAPWEQAVAQYTEFIAAETLATTVRVSENGTAPDGDHTVGVELAKDEAWTP